MNGPAADVHDPEATRALIARLAADLRFAVVRVAAVPPETPRIGAYDAWLDAGHHADLDWLVRDRDLRADPRRKLRSARSAIVVAVEHHHARPPDPGGRTGSVARYAWGRDYHNLVGKRMKKLRARLREHGLQAWGTPDGAPILERAWAEAAGVGFVGKNTVLFRPARTSWLFLGVVFIDREATPDAPLEADHCGRCRRCITGCPTDAFVADRVLDARRCVSYWTIEARGLAPRALRPGFGRWLFGCDVCQEVCPHDAAPPTPDEDDLLPRNAWLDCDALILAADADLEARFVGTPLFRPGAVGLKRNALIVLGNLGDDGAVPTARVALAHPAPVVRAAAVWALTRLGAPPLAHTDDDPGVRDELDWARSVAGPQASAIGP